MHAGRSVGLLLVFTALGCSSSSSLEGGCLPLVDCKTHLEQVEDSPGCASCPNCGADWGSCTPGGLACKSGQVDLSSDQPTCETAAAGAHANYVTHSSGDSIGILSINQDRFAEPISATVVALDANEPGCIPPATAECSYTFRALQLELGEFEIEPKDTLSWSNGTLTIAGPVSSNVGLNGIGPASASAVLAFTVSHGDERRIAVASSLVSFALDFSDISPIPSLRVQGAGFDFGGYEIDDLEFEGKLSPP